MISKAITIVGGGWSGLSCAVELKKNKLDVQLLESSRQLGGRARCGQFHHHSIDNGQHILVGACKYTLTLLSFLGLSEQQAFLRYPLNLTYHSPQHNPIQIQSGFLPAPLHLISAILTAKGFTYLDKYALLGCFIKIHLSQFSILEDLELEAFLIHKGQSNKLIKSFWEPLALAILNTPIKIASTKVFLRVLEDSFSKNKHDSDFLLFKKPLCETLPKYAENYLNQDKTIISLKHKIQAIDIQENQLRGFFINNTFYTCEHLILATPLSTTCQLLKPFAKNNNVSILVNKLQKFRFQPITTIYLYFAKSLTLEQPIYGFLDCYTQWLLDRSILGQDDVLSVVISGPGVHENLNNSQLIKTIDKELRQFYQLPELIDAIVIKEKKATFSCEKHVNQYRPDNNTDIKGLYLAGDYTNTGYPATLEGAIISGKKAAGILIHEFK